MYYARGVLHTYIGNNYLNACELLNVQSYYQHREKSLDTKEIRHVSIYPNPSTDKVTVDIAFESDLVSSISVFDVSGKIVLNAALSVGKNQINISKLNAGIYFYQVIVNDYVEAAGKLQVLSQK